MEKNSGRFIFDLGNIYGVARNLHITKWNELRITAMIFDVLGLIAPITLQPKLLHREIYRKKFDWD